MTPSLWEMNKRSSPSIALIVLGWRKPVNTVSKESDCNGGRLGVGSVDPTVGEVTPVAVVVSVPSGADVSEPSEVVVSPATGGVESSVGSSPELLRKIAPIRNTTISPTTRVRTRACAGEGG